MSNHAVFIYLYITPHVIAGAGDILVTFYLFSETLTWAQLAVDATIF
jgi:hypothetical protein